MAQRARLFEGRSRHCGPGAVPVSARPLTCVRAGVRLAPGGVAGVEVAGAAASDVGHWKAGAGLRAHPRVSAGQESAFSLRQKGLLSS